MRSLGLRAAFTLLGAFFVLALAAIPALSDHTQTATFDGSDTDAGAFASLQRLAVHQGSGTVFAIDSGNQVVDRFDSSGTAEAFSATGSSSLGDPGTGDTWDLGADSDITVDSSGTSSDGNLYVLSAADFGDQNVFAFDSAGNHLFTIDGDPTVGSGSDICGVAVDPGGDLWVSDFANSQVVEFDSSGSATGNTVDTSGQGNPCHSAIDTAGDLYVAMWQGPVHKYELASGSHLGQVDPDPTFSVAVDPSNDHVFAVHSDRVSEYDASGAAVSEFGSSELTSAVGGAALGSSGDVYVSDQDDDLVHVFSPPAPAERTQTSTFDGSDTDAGAFGELQRLAVHQGSGTVFAIDSANQVVDRFDSSGTAEAFSATGSSSLGDPGTGETWDLGADSDVAVDSSGTASDGQLYVLSAADFGDQNVFAFDSAGNHLFTIDGDPTVGSGSDICGVAVDPGGDLWVSDFANSQVVEFDSSGSATGNTVDTSGQGSPCHSAIDTAGNLYVALWQGAVHKYELASGSHLGQVDPDPTFSVAVDPSNDHVFAVHSDRVSEYDASGAAVSEFGSSELTSAVGGAALGSSGDVYVSDQDDDLVHVFGFGAPAEAPTAAIEPVSEITASSATLNGTVNPGGAETSYQFEYRPASDPDWSGATSVPVPAGEAGDGTSEVAVSESVTGLDPDTDYLVRLVATSSEGSDTSAEASFSTLAPPSATIDPVAGITADGATFAGTVNPHGAATSYQFEYRPASDPDWSGATSVPVPAGEAGDGTSEVAVSESVTGLDPDTDYLVRLVATNPRGDDTSDVEAFRTSPAGSPAVAIDPATHVFATQATFNGQVNPGGAPTSYQFEYRPASDPDWSDATSVPVPAGELAGGIADTVVAERTGGLEADTRYLVRLVATNPEGSKTSPATAFQTRPPLRAERAFEQVTPADKGDAAVEMGDYTMASTAGGRLFFRTRGALPGSESATVRNNNMARRGAAGWSTTPLDPPLRVEPGVGSEFEAFTPDLSAGLLEALDPPVLVSGEPRDVQDLFLRETVSGRFSLLTGTDPVAKEASLTSGINVFWASRDLGHVLFDPLGDTRYFEGDGGRIFYHADAATGEVTMPAFLPDESTADPDDEIRAGTPPFGEATAGAGISGVDWRQGAISEDGSRVFFTAGQFVFGNSPRGGAQLFVRKGRGTPGAHTVRVSAPEPGASDPTGEEWPAWFRAASADGSRVFFTSCDPLTADSTADATRAFEFIGTCSPETLDPSDPEDDRIGLSDLYMFDVDADGGAGDLVDLTGTEMTVNDNPSVPADVWGFVGAAEDGSRAYFVALGNLTADASGDGPKLYVWEEGSGLSLVATLNPALPRRSPGSPPERPQTPDSARGDSRVWLPPISAHKEARVAPDGQHLAFSSKAPLEPGFDNTEASAEACGDPEVAGEACYQVYLYDAAAEELVCASCAGSGPATGDATLRSQLGGLETPPSGLYEQRNLTDDGGLVFFDTAAGLVPEDANGNVDAYGFDAESGEAFLVSSGNRGHRATFVNASADGSDAFFKTRERLVGSDTDRLVDIYDARIGGGFPAPPPTPAEDCGVDCQGEPALPPAEGAIGSDASNGPDNLGRCRLLRERRTGLHRRAVLRHRQARRLALRARRTSGRAAIRRARRARLVYRRARLLHRHELRLVRRIQLCASERSE